jgi:hypothetical protein
LTFHNKSAAFNSYLELIYSELDETVPQQQRDFVVKEIIFLKLCFKYYYTSEKYEKDYLNYKKNIRKLIEKSLAQNQSEPKPREGIDLTSQLNESAEIVLNNNPGNEPGNEPTGGAPNNSNNSSPEKSKYELLIDEYDNMYKSKIEYMRFKILYNFYLFKFHLFLEINILLFQKNVITRTKISSVYSAFN